MQRLDSTENFNKGTMSRTLSRSGKLGQIVEVRFTDGVYTSGSHSSTFQLNLSALYGRGGARRGCVARVHGAFAGVYGV